MKSLILIICLGVSFLLTGCLEGKIKTIGSSPAASNSSLTYSWIIGSWGNCSAIQCGSNGTQLRNVICRNSNSIDVADSFCASSGVKPAVSQSCSASSCPMAPCPLPQSLGGGTLASGTSIIAYQAATVPQGQTCVSQSRACSNGALSGSYLYSSCVVETAPPQTGNGIVIDLSYVNVSSAAYTRFKNMVDGVVNGGGLPYGFAGIDAAYMYRITNQTVPGYCTVAIRMAENQVAAAEAAIAGGGRPAVSGDSYLEVGPFITDVAIAYDWCRNQITAAQRTRWPIMQIKQFTTYGIIKPQLGVEDHILGQDGA